jgi:hypothetical protein
VTSRARQRGAAAVELALTIPTAMLLVGGMLYLGRALHARGRVLDAVSYAARAGSIAAGGQAGGAVDSNWIRSTVVTRLADSSDCVQPVGVTAAAGGVAPYRHLDVTARCQLVTPILGAFLPTFSLNTVEATATMPIDDDTP